MRTPLRGMLFIAFAIGLFAASPCLAEPVHPYYAAVEREIDVFLGPMRGDYILPGALVSDQVDEAMGGPDETLDAGPGRSLITGFRPHSAEERGAVLLDAQNHVLAVGLISYHCRTSAGASCQPDPSL